MNFEFQMKKSVQNEKVKINSIDNSIVICFISEYMLYFG